MNIYIRKFNDLTDQVQKRILMQIPYERYKEEYPYIVFYDSRCSVFISSNLPERLCKLNLWDYISYKHNEIKIINLGQLLHNCQLSFIIMKYIDNTLYDDINIYYNHLLPLLGENYAARSIVEYI